MNRNKRYHNLICYIKQKIIGVLFIAVTIWLAASGLLYDETIGGNDCTIALFTIPVGIYLIKTDKLCLYKDIPYDEFSNYD